MAKCNHTINWRFPGRVVVTFILLFLSISVYYLIDYAFQNKSDSQLVLSEPYFWQIVRFSFLQASLSALLSILGAILLASAIYTRQFKGRTLFLRFLSTTFILPTLVVILGLMSVYGYQGWLSQLCRILGFEYHGSIYGMSGILIAHIFYNLPFAFRLFLQSLNAIPAEYHQLSTQLGFNTKQHFCYIEWPALRRHILPTAALIFILCFTSFAIVLTLGGSPKYTTLEVAIYQAIRDFEWPQAVTMSLFQGVICLTCLILMQKWVPVLSAISSPHQGFVRIKTKWQAYWDILIIFGAGILFIPPILAIIIDGLLAIRPAYFTNPVLWQAMFTSLKIALSAGILALLFSLMLLWTTRHALLLGFHRLTNRLIVIASLILGMPSLLIGVGFFLYFQQSPNTLFSPTGLLIITNALMAIPFTIKLLEAPMNDSAIRYHSLVQTLHLSGLRRFYWIDFKAIKASIRLAFGFSVLISLGDFGIIALFGSEDLITLPYYLYQQMAAYRNSESAVTALLLLLLSFLLFSILDKGKYRHD